MLDEPVERSDAGAAFTTAEDLGMVDIESGQIGPGATSLVFVLDFHDRAGLRRESGMFSASCLDAGLFVR